MKSALITAEYKVITPMFCGGESHQPEFRLPSFKGVLRYWWRALAWPRLGGDLAKVQAQENRLFGSTEAQALVRMQLKAQPKCSPLSPPAVLGKNGCKGGSDNRRAPNVVGEGARYLGYGVMEAFGGRNTTAGRLTKGCLSPAFSFTVQLRLKGLNAEEIDSLSDALKAVGLLGGMGAKSRKGYGSLALQTLSSETGESWTAPKNTAAFQAEIAKLFKRNQAAFHDEYAPYTAFSAKSRVVVVEALGIDALALLDRVGREIGKYRSWGNRRNGDDKHKAFGKKAEQNFKDDHDLIKRRIGGKHPERIVFGLPHTDKVKPKDFDRRGSPLFIHIHPLGNEFAAVLTFLPALFLPEGQRAISVNNKPIQQRPEERLYKPMNVFLDRMLGDESRKETFTNEIEVTP